MNHRYDKPVSPGRLNDVQGTFTAFGSTPAPAQSAGPSVLRAKVFKSGNSLALRLPAALGLEAGMEMELTVQTDGSYHLSRADTLPKRLDIRGFAGKLPGFQPAPREDFEERPSAIARRQALSGE